MSASGGGSSQSNDLAWNYSLRVSCRLRFQPVDATHWLNRTAGVS